MMGTLYPFASLAGRSSWFCAVGCSTRREGGYLLYIVRHGYLGLADLMRFARVGKALNGNALALALELALSNGLLTSKVPKS